MKNRILPIAAASLLLPEDRVVALSTAPGAEARTVKLEVPNMTGAGRVIAVRHGVTRVPGVLDARLDLGSRTAIVRYEPQKTTVDAIAAATREVGFPSRPVK